MSDISAKQTVQGGSILDALSKLLFKGLDHIFDAASEYQKEMGVLKQVTKIPVQNPIDTSKKYEFVVKLVPIKDKDGIYYIEVECPGYSKFKPGPLHQSTIKLNNKNLKEFYKTIDELLKKNDLERIEADKPDKKEDSSEDKSEHKKSVNEYTDVYTFSFHSYDENETEYTVGVTIESSTDYSRATVSVSSDPKLSKKFMRPIVFKDDAGQATNRSADAKVGDELEDFLFSGCGLQIDEDNADAWSEFIEMLNDMSTKNPADFDKNNSSDSGDNPQNAAASIRVTLERVVASDNHEDINLVSINASGCTEEHAIDIVTYIVGSDEFVDQMPVGESSYIITDEDDDYDIVPC